MMETQELSQNGQLKTTHQHAEIMRYFKFYNKQDLLSVTKVRRFETKIGERLQVINDSNNHEKSLANTTAKFVILGIPEDLGVKANCGIGGSDTVWIPFLTSFLNI